MVEDGRFCGEKQRSKWEKASGYLEESVAHREDSVCKGSEVRKWCGQKTEMRWIYQSNKIKQEEVGSEAGEVDWVPLGYRENGGLELKDYRELQAGV